MIISSEIPLEVGTIYNHHTHPEMELSGLTSNYASKFGFYVIREASRQEYLDYLIEMKSNRQPLFRHYHYLVSTD